MLKLLFSFCLAFFVFTNVNYAYAKKISIAVIVSQPNLDFPDASKTHLKNQLTNLFNPPNYALIQNQAIAKEWQDKISINFFSDPKKLDKIQRQTLLELSKKYNYNYILVLTYSIDQSIKNENILNRKKAIQISLDAKLFQGNSGRYLYNNTITRIGSTKTKSFKDFPEMTEAIVRAANYCTNHLFSDLELPLVKKSLY